MTIEELRKLTYLTQGRATMQLAEDPDVEAPESRALFAKANFYAGISYVLGSVRESSAEALLDLLNNFVDFQGLEGDTFSNHIFDKAESTDEVQETTELPDAFKNLFDDKDNV